MLVPKELVAWWVKHHSLRLHVLFNRKNNNNNNNNTLITQDSINQRRSWIKTDNNLHYRIDTYTSKRKDEVKNIFVVEIMGLFQSWKMRLKDMFVVKTKDGGRERRSNTVVIS